MAGDARPKRPVAPPDDEDDRVIITKGEDFRLYQRSVWQVLDDSGWALFVVIGVLAMAIVGIVLTILS